MKMDEFLKKYGTDLVRIAVLETIDRVKVNPNFDVKAHTILDPMLKDLTSALQDEAESRKL